MASRAFLRAVLAGSALGQNEKKRGTRARTGRPRGWDRWLGEPRNAVFFVLGSALLIGGGRKLLQAVRAREAVGKLEDDSVTPEQVAEAVEHGRAGLMDLFRLLADGRSEAVRVAAGQALAALWARDELIAEEEKALVRRGYHVQWKARRRYPRALRGPIPIEAAFGVPFLSESEGKGVRPSNLEWSHAVAGSRRASTEVFGDWSPGPGRVAFAIVPDDFETNGPHRLELRTRVRTAGLTERWELDLPFIPFLFELDPLLAVDALLAMPDDARGALFDGAVRLVPARPEGSAPTFLPLNETLAIRDAPSIEVVTPLPCDLAHAVFVEIADVPGRFPAGAVVVSGQGSDPNAGRSRRVFALASIADVPREAIERPGTRRMRACLVPDPERGWADPDVRSIWPGAITTPWTDVTIVRR